MATALHASTLGAALAEAHIRLSQTGFLINGAKSAITAGVVSGPVAQPGITSISLSGTSLVINGTNGPAGQQYEVLTSTNLTVPLTNWVSIATNTFIG